MFEQRDPLNTATHDGERPTIDHGDARAGRFAGARILIVGCGDVGRRLITQIGDRFRIFATVRSPAGTDSLRRVGAVPIVADLDDPRTLDRLGGIAPIVVHLAPPRSQGMGDPRTRALLRVLHGVERLIYISTSGVYGDCHGDWIDETRTPAPATDRARRRVDAERQLRAWSREHRVALTILRVPGIYASDRVPLARIEAGTPVLRASDDVYTNHIHADDLARLIVFAIWRGTTQRVYHAVDDSALKMGYWFDLVADAHRLARPERVTRDVIAERVAPNLLSFMSESRRLSNRRMHGELGFKLAYPTVREGLAAIKKGPHDGGP